MNASTPEPAEAAEARPWRPGDGPEPRVRTWPHGGEPLLRVRVGGIWRLAPVLARFDWPDGRVSYQVEISLTAPDGIRGVYIRSYWWNPRAMQPVRGGRG